MKLFDDIKMYGRFAFGLRSFLRHTITLEEAKAIVRRRMEERENNFIRLLEKGVYGYQRSPYTKMLRLAQVEIGDIQAMVRNKGLENTLQALREAGVFVSFEEFKGRKPIVRDGKTLRIEPKDFDNPYLKGHYQSQSGGSTGAGTRVTQDLDNYAAKAPHLLLAGCAHGLLDSPVAMWLGTLPDGSGIGVNLTQARIGNVPIKWFSPIGKQNVQPDIKYRLATQIILHTGRLCGLPFPKPEIVHLDQAVVIARWLEKTVRRYGSCMVRTITSLAMRVCLAAGEEGIDLAGVTFVGGGEPVTPAKVSAILDVGARFVPVYVFTEGGYVGWGCARPYDYSDVHFFKDSLALILHSRGLPFFEEEVNTFHFTTLLPTAPKLLLNMETDDFGIVEKRSCGCPLEEYGFLEHIRQIKSFSKLTGEGVTLVGSDMISILEKDLPTQFGGTPLDYQLVEEEDEKGFTRLNLVIAPGIYVADEGLVVRFVLEKLKESNPAGDLAREIWRQADAFRIKRVPPRTTGRGKHMSLLTAKEGGTQKNSGQPLT